ncbi:RNA helicase [Plakobranchus ocellatus]|uniref:RNA helicase n=1 Tax=Plakobranchus ocellatus TaxID=259542 RepID=A0AAV3Y8Q8_9GAST|nr:RNA helicase [Plakobranchus ocellatus]
MDDCSNPTKKAPDCTTKWPAATAPEVLLKLIHPSTVSKPSPVSKTKAEKVKWPVISPAGTSEEWAYFQQRWSDYKTATHLTGKRRCISAPRMLQ